MPKLDYRNIEKDPARCGDQPVVVGTRIRVATILTCDEAVVKAQCGASKSFDWC